MSAGGTERSEWRRNNPDPPWQCWICDKPIIKGSGQDSDSLAVHHVNGPEDPVTLVPVHLGCHSRFHNPGERSARPEIRAKIAATLKGRKPSPKVIEANRRRKGEKRGPVSAARLANIRAAVNTPAEKARRSTAAKKQWEPGGSLDQARQIKRRKS